MRRSLITAFAVLAILLQGISTAWAGAAHPVSQHQQSSGTMSDMPCHQHGKRDSAKPACCCENSCNCADLCGTASAALPMQIPTLDEYVQAHFESLQSAPEVFPAHTLSRLRPPISHS